MPLTTGSNIFHCTRDEAKFVAECLGLVQRITSELDDRRDDFSIQYDAFDLWEDKRTAGGGCRIVWCKKVAWISRHSGYEWADMTGDAADVFEEIGCKNLEHGFSMMNPLIYGMERVYAAKDRFDLLYAVPKRDLP